MIEKTEREVRKLSGKSERWKEIVSKIRLGNVPSVPNPIQSDPLICGIPNFKCTDLSEARLFLRLRTGRVSILGRVQVH